MRVENTTLLVGGATPTDEASTEGLKRSVGCALTDQDHRPAGNWAERVGLLRYWPTLHDVAMFLSWIGGRL